MEKPSNWSKLQKETSEEFVDKLLLYVRTNNFEAFCFLKEKKISILEANIKSKRKYEGIIPGRVVKLNLDGSIDCLCADGVLTITKISYNKKIMKPKKNN